MDKIQFHCETAKKPVVYLQSVRKTHLGPKPPAFIDCSGLEDCGVRVYHAEDGSYEFRWHVCPIYRSMNQGNHASGG
jgi:hypothetical protein